MTSEERDTAIIVAAKEHGIIAFEMPDGAEARAKLAGELILKAQRARNKGPAVTAVLTLAEIEVDVEEAPAGDATVDPGDAPDEPVEEAPADPEPAAEASEPSSSSGIFGDAGPGGRQAAELHEFARARLKKERLPPPAEVDGDTTPLPNDPTKLSDGAIRQLYWERHVLHSRAVWLVSTETVDWAAAHRVREGKVAKIVKGLEIDARAAKLDRTKTSMVNEAYEDAEVQEWDKRYRAHEAVLDQWKALRDIYASDVEVLSREMTMRSKLTDQGASPAPR
jgi:hypothetical protein